MQYCLYNNKLYKIIELDEKIRMFTQNNPLNQIRGIAKIQEVRFGEVTEAPFIMALEGITILKGNLETLRLLYGD